MSPKGREIANKTKRPPQRNAVRLLARNVPPKFPCADCGAEAAYIDTEATYDSENPFYCEKCAESRDEDMLRVTFGAEIFSSSFAVLMSREGFPRRQGKGYQQGSAKAIHEKRQRTRRKSGESGENRIPCENPVFGV